MTVPALTDLQRAIIDGYQQHLPSSLTPYQDMASELGSNEADVIAAIDDLIQRGLIRRLGPVFDHHRAGASTLVAMAIPTDKLEQEALSLNTFAGINHNYEREHQYNLWFVLTASHDQALQQRLEAICERHPWPVLVLPMEQAYHINLGFPLNWNGGADDVCAKR
jgi:siroheme decarboxylase